MALSTVSMQYSKVNFNRIGLLGLLKASNNFLSDKTNVK